MRNHKDKECICVDSSIPSVSVIPLTLFSSAESLIYPLRFKSHRPQQQSSHSHKGTSGSQLSKLQQPTPTHGIPSLSHNFFVIQHFTTVCLTYSFLIYCISFFPVTSPHHTIQAMQLCNDGNWEKMYIITRHRLNKESLKLNGKYCTMKHNSGKCKRSIDFYNISLKCLISAVRGQKRRWMFFCLGCSWSNFANVN